MAYNFGIEGIISSNLAKLLLGFILLLESELSGWLFIMVKNRQRPRMEVFSFPFSNESSCAEKEELQSIFPVESFYFLWRQRTPYVGQVGTKSMGNFRSQTFEREHENNI